MSRVWANLINVKFYDIITAKGDEFKMTIFILVIWMLLGGYMMVENSDLIASLEDKQTKAIAMAIITVSAPFYMLNNLFDYMLGEIFGDAWEDDDDETGTC